MIKPFFNLLLAIVIVSCPIRCLLGWTDCCCSALERAQVTESDCCCDKQSQSVPAELPEKPVKNCKCICSGATMPDHVDLDHELQSQPLFASNHPERVRSACLLIDQFHPPDDPRPESIDNSVNIGRLLRCLHSSLTI